MVTKRFRLLLAGRGANSGIFRGIPLETAKFNPGDEVTVAVFQEGDKVRVSGLTKGRGFQGVVKRHGFAGGPKTHGQKNR